MKYCIIITDGASGHPLTEYKNRTSLEAACTPYLDLLACEGELGISNNVPLGMEPSSAIACMSLLGYDPKVFYKGRASIEAVSLNVPMEENCSIFRCNFVNIQDGIMRSYNSGEIQSNEASILIKALNEKLGSDVVEFYPGVNYRHILKIKDGGASLNATTTAPHDISDKSIIGHLPCGPGSQILNELMEASKDILRDHYINKNRVVNGEIPASQIWLFWGAPPLKKWPSMQEKYGLNGAISSAVPLLNGLGTMMGMDILSIDGVTDTDTNDYSKQIAESIKALDKYDLVVVHVEAPDEMGHIGDAKRKIGSIEDIDKYMVSAIYEYAKDKDMRVLIMPDHPTPIELKTHTSEPVPYLLWGTGIKRGLNARFAEKQAKKSGNCLENGYNMMKKLTEATS